MNSRRQFVRTSTALFAAPGAIASALIAANDKAPPGVTAAPPKPPALTPEKVKAIVGEAHRNLDAVRALVEETPLLVNAAWDWGGGDFETPLQAAAHLGRRAIAEYLLAQNARPDLFASAMLGELEVIQAALARNPQAHEIPGPHGFTLLHCAKQGGEPAKPVYDFLIARGAPEVFHRPLPFKWPAGTSSQ